MLSKLLLSSSRLLKQAMSKDNLFVFLIGIPLCFVGFGVMLAPFHVSSGGFAGLAEILNTQFGLLYIVGFWGLTMILLIFCYLLEKRKKVKRWFTLRTAIITFLIAFLLDAVPSEWFRFVVDSPLPPAVIGSFIYGIGLACIIFGNGSTGGTECIGIIVTPFIMPRLARVFSKMNDEKLESAIMVTLTFAFNAVVITIAGFVYGFANFLMSALSLTICMCAIYLTLSLLKIKEPSQPDKPSGVAVQTPEVA